MKFPAKATAFVGAAAACLWAVAAASCASTSTTSVVATDSSTAVEASSDAGDGSSRTVVECTTNDQDLKNMNPAAFRDAAPVGACSVDASCSFDFIGPPCNQVTDYVACSCMNSAWSCDFVREADQNGCSGGAGGP